jgi:hypothetical protein
MSQLLFYTLKAIFVSTFLVKLACLDRMLIWTARVPIFKQNINSFNQVIDVQVTSCIICFPAQPYKRKPCQMLNFLLCRSF